MSRLALPRQIADAGIALADLDQDGRFDLVVFAIEKGPAATAPTTASAAASMPTAPSPAAGRPGPQIPDWSAKENSGGDIALADLDGDGTPELIVVMVDADGGHYRVGWKLGATGTVEETGSRGRRSPTGSRATATGSAPTSPTSTATGGPSCWCSTAAAARSAGGSTRRAASSEGWGPWTDPPGGRAPRNTAAAFVCLIDGRAAGADGARQRRRRGAARRGRRGRPGQGRRLADPRPQLADPRRARRAAAHRRRPVVRRLRRRPRRPRGRPLPHPRLALPEPPLQLPAHADRPLLRRPDLPRGRPAARRRRHRPVHALPRHPRRPGLRPRGPALDPRAADAAAALVPDAHHARRRPHPLGLRPRRLARARARPGELRGRRGLAAAAVARA